MAKIGIVCAVEDELKPYLDDYVLKAGQHPTGLIFYHEPATTTKLSR